MGFFQVFQCQYLQIQSEPRTSLITSTVLDSISASSSRFTCTATEIPANRLAQGALTMSVKDCSFSNPAIAWRRWLFWIFQSKGVIIRGMAIIQRNTVLEVTQCYIYIKPRGSIKGWEVGNFTICDDYFSWLV